MSVADGCRQRIRRIVRLRYFLQVQDGLDHDLYLFFIRPTIPHKGLLDLQRCIFFDFQSALDTGEDRDSSGLSYSNRSLGVGIKKQFFDGGHIGTMLLNDLP